ncbi:6053_t:CDS:2, partial [Funneliformis geosporum]
MDVGANDKKKRSTVEALGYGKEDLKEKEYLGEPIMIKITVEENFTSSFLKLSDCVLIDVQ